APGERVWLDWSATAEGVAPLTARGLVVRLRAARDGRSNRLRLTAAGFRTTERLTARAVRMNRMLVSVLSDGEQAELLRMLNLVVDADERLRNQRSSLPHPLGKGRGGGQYSEAG